MCAILLLIVAVLLVVAALAKIWPFVLAAVVVWVAVSVTRQQRANRARAAQRAHADAIATHEQAVAYWRAQAGEVDTPVARQVAEGLVAYNEDRLRELGHKEKGQESA